MNPGGSRAAPAACTRLSCWAMPSTISTARDLPSISRPALMPRIRSGQRPGPPLERAADTLGDRFLDARQVHDALAQHRGLHLLEVAVVAVSAALGGRRPCGRIRPTSSSSRRSSTPISVAAISTSIDSSACTLPSTILAAARSRPAPARAARPGRARRACRRSCAACSTCGASSCGWPAPRRTKISSTSLTLARSSRMAAATVCMSLTLGADRFSRSCSMPHRPAAVARRNEARTAVTRGPEDSARADVVQEVVQQIDGRGLRVARLALLVEAA